MSKRKDLEDAVAATLLRWQNLTPRILTEEERAQIKKERALIEEAGKKKPPRLTIAID